MRRIVLWTACGAALTAVAVNSALAAPAVELVKPKQDVSFRLELANAIAKGLKWLEKKQSADGSWSQPEYPALSALALTAFMGEPSGKYKSARPAVVQKGYAYLLKNVQSDGGIYSKASQTPMENYNTAIAMTALIVARDPAFEPTIRKARQYLIGLQNDGGIGYNKDGHSDMSNSVMALEALYYSKYLARDEAGQKAKDLNWAAAVAFIQRCQNLPEYNKEAWVSDDPQNKGGFVYYPGDSKAGEMKTAGGKTALRSYGSISYAGLLSYAYADLTKDDPRVAAVLKWLAENYTLDENPGMGQEGLYYYYHMMAKALSAAGVTTLTTKGGRTVDWRRELALKLLSLQSGEDGSWVNQNGRWWEKDPVLTTSYSLIALEVLYRSL
ncbi:MAG: terpene cyclase/mutase family protein [Deltaproteobacteria bacterium]|nr:terpene cyclase/mutase family protein [Deltaproteobacteria bacterium]